ncbi:MAG: hypothetical protein ACKVOI_06410 [Dongiaceae bacterium]
MAKAKRSKTKQSHGPKPAREQSHGHAAGANKQITAQNRKLLGKHYANKYPVGS